MSKIIIDNRSDLTIDEALARVASVIEKGRTSGDGRDYCYETTGADGVTVFAARSVSNDTFVVATIESTN